MPIPTSPSRGRVWILACLALVGVSSCGQAPDSPAAVDDPGTDASPAAVTADSSPAEDGTGVPRTADGHPDFTGVLYPGADADPDNFGVTAADYRTFDPAVTPQEAPSLQPWAQEKIRLMGANHDLAAIRPSTQCLPRGPTLWGLGAQPIQIIQTPDQIVLLSELGTTWRIIHTDGRPQEDNPEPQYHGHSVGHWEGDTLVVDVVGMDPHVWIQGGPGTPAGWFVSDELHVVERWSRPDPDTLTYQATIEDPKVLTEPWTSAVRSFTYAPGKRLYEYFCSNNVDLEELIPDASHLPRTPEGNDARFWDPQEYERLREQFP